MNVATSLTITAPAAFQRSVVPRATGCSQAALRGATAAGRWEVVSRLAKELEARRLARAGNVVALEAKVPRRHE
jgi:hypothetical protein